MYETAIYYLQWTFSFYVVNIYSKVVIKVLYNTQANVLAISPWYNKAPDKSL